MLLWCMRPPLLNATATVSASPPRRALRRVESDPSEKEHVEVTCSMGREKRTGEEGKRREWTPWRGERDRCVHVHLSSESIQEAREDDLI